MAKWLIFIFSLIFVYYIYQNFNKEPSIATIFPDLEPIKLRPSDIENGYEEIDLNIYSETPEKPLELEDNNAENIFNNQDISELSINQITDNNNGLNIIKIENKKNNIQTKQKNCYRLQLATVKDKDTGIKLWNNYKNKFPDILKNTHLVLKKIEQGTGKFYFLVLSGEYDNISSARNVCNKLINNKQSCIIFKDN